MPTAHVFVGDIEAPELDDDDRHHLERVLRLRPGEEVSACDGAGAIRVCRVRRGMALEPTGSPVRAERPVPAVTVGFAVPKGERPAWIVQKLTEAGVDRIVPFVASRSVVRWEPERAARQVERLRRIAREAAMQCRRAWLPDVAVVVSFPEAVDIAGPATALAVPEGDRPGLDRPAVLVGPEGGWADDELACGLPTVAVGAHVLRTETAAVAAGLLLCALRAGLVRSVSEPAPGAQSAMGWNYQH